MNVNREMIGTTLSHFKITAKLGEGGMGEVYLAEDTNLGREVAIKVLPEAMASDRERLARFEREAKALGSLNHPNIAAIYEVGEADDVHFLAMELAEGEDLADRLSRGPIPVDEALPLALQIAKALEAAHEKGIVHRDLKPSNVMVTEEGRVKVLDFGLAKATEPEPLAGDETLFAESPTQVVQMTEPGVVLGTAAYMSPEQARGKPVDKRTDIWSFGCLLFEMLSGRRAFEGETGTDTLAAILKHDPPWKRLPGALSARIQDLLRRCLRKDPTVRLRDIGDARIELLDDLNREPVGSTGLDTPMAAPTFSRRGLLIGSLVVVLLAASTAVWQLLPETPVVILIDTTAPLGVYDPDTRKAGRTNADDLTDALGDLPVTLVKETSSPSWHREYQVLQQRPHLLIIHKSAFAHQPRFGEFEKLSSALAELEALGLENPMELGKSKMVAFLGYIALGSPDTRFIVYARGSFAEETRRAQWLSAAEKRFPELEGRIVLFDVPGEVGTTATLRAPATAEEMKRLVASTLAID